MIYPQLGMPNRGVEMALQGSMIDNVLVFDTVTNFRVHDSIQHLENVTTEEIIESSSTSTANSVDQCSICLGDLSSGSKAILQMPQPCGHVFHEDCIIRWLNIKSTCAFMPQKYLLVNIFMDSFIDFCTFFVTFFS